MKCPDCGNLAKKMGVFYTCQVCGLSVKPWELEKAHKRSRDEIREITKDEKEKPKRRRRRETKTYRNWVEDEIGYDDE